MSIYPYGATVRLTTTVRDADDQPATPAAIDLRIQLEDEVVLGPFTPAADETGQYHYDYAAAAAGRHVARWTTEGPDGVDETSFDVAAQWSEGWRPTLVDVAGHIPTRTRDLSNPGNDVLLNTFTATTTPTPAQAQPVIDAAVSTVKSMVAAIPPAIEALARDAAAWRAAADIELAYPQRDADIRVYQQLNDRADRALKTLVAASDAAGTSTEATLPQWAMPAPVPWGDDNL